MASGRAKVGAGVVGVALVGTLVAFGPGWLGRLDRAARPVRVEAVESLKDVRPYSGDVPPWPVTVSPDFKRVAVVRGGKSATDGGLFLDGQRLWSFGGMYSNMLEWSADGATLAGSMPGILYVGTQSYPIPDVGPAPPFDFSYDGHRWRVPLGPGEKFGTQRYLVDGKEVLIEGIIGGPFFLAGRLGYLTKDELIVEGSPPRPNPAPQINPASVVATADGRTLLISDPSATADILAGRVVAVSLADGAKQEFVGARPAGLTPDGSRYFFVLHRGYDRQHMVIDGAVGPGFADVPGWMFAPDGRTLIVKGFNPKPAAGESTYTLLADHAVIERSATPIPQVVSIEPRIATESKLDRRRGTRQHTVTVGGRALGPYDMIVPARFNNWEKRFDVAADGTVTFYAVRDGELVRVRVR